MADQNILKAQKYLNSMYGHRSEWVKIDEDGITGVKLCQGIIRAFQIENGVTPVTGNIGNVTLSKMRELKNISKMKEIQKVYLKNSRMSSSENNIAVLTSAKWEYA